MSPTKQDHELETLLERYGEAYHQYEHEVQFGDTIGKDEDAERTLRLAEAAVLARMQRPVIAVTDAMVERFYRAFYDILVTSGWDKSDEFARIRVGIEAALREDGEA